MNNQTNTRRKYLDDLVLKGKIQSIADENATVSAGDELTPVCPECGGTEFAGRYLGRCDVSCTFTGNGDEPIEWHTHDHDDETLEGVHCHNCGADYDGLFDELVPGVPGREPIA